MMKCRILCGEEGTSNPSRALKRGSGDLIKKLALTPLFKGLQRDYLGDAKDFMDRLNTVQKQGSSPGRAFALIAAAIKAKKDSTLVHDNVDSKVSYFGLR